MNWPALLYSLKDIDYMPINHFWVRWPLGTRYIENVGFETQKLVLEQIAIFVNSSESNKTTIFWFLA